MASEPIKYESLDPKKTHPLEPSLLERIAVMGFVVPAVVIGVQAYFIYESIRNKVKSFQDRHSSNYQN